MNTFIRISAITVALITVSVHAAGTPLSSPEIELPSCPVVEQALDIPRKIEVAEKVSVGTIGLTPESWGEKRIDYFGDYKPNEEAGKMEYIDPLTSEEASSVDHYELTYHGDKLVRIAHYDRKGLLKVDDENKSAIIDMRYDRDGNLIEQSSYNESSELARDWYGYAVYRWDYDDKGRKTAGTFYDENSRVATRSYSDVAVTRWEYDGDDRQTLWVNYDKSGSLTKDVLGAAAMIYDYDDDGRKTLEATYGIDRKLALNKRGYSILRISYDDSGRWTDMTYFGPDMKPIRSGGVAMVKRTYNDKAQQAETAFYDGTGKLAENQEGVAILVSTLDDKGKEIEQRIYGRDVVLKDAMRIDPESGEWERIPLEDQDKSGDGEASSNPEEN